MKGGKNSEFYISIGIAFVVAAIVFFTILEQSGRIYYSVGGAIVIGFGLIFPIMWIIISTIFHKPSDDEKKELIACPRCGSKNISGLKFMRNWLKKFGPIMGFYSCQECGYEGFPVEFDTEEDYKRYFQEIENKQKEDSSK
ncbi:hypothetical protein ACFLRC_00095 [Candidatus Altiarchaeota archaeon]